MTLEGRISVRPDQVTMAGDLIRVHYKAPERIQYVKPTRETEDKHLKY